MLYTLSVTEIPPEHYMIEYQLYMTVCADLLVQIEVILLSNFETERGSVNSDVHLPKSSHTSPVTKPMPIEELIQ